MAFYVLLRCCTRFLEHCGKWLLKWSHALVVAVTHLVAVVVLVGMTLFKTA